MKKIISILVLLALLLYTFSPLAFAGEPYNKGSNGYKHQFNNWKAELTKEQMQQMKCRALKDRIRIKGKYLDYDVPPVIKDGRALIPVRAITRGLGADVDWDPDERKIIITRGDVEIILQLDSNIYYVNGKKQELEVPACLHCNRTFVPLRFIAEALGDRVNYDDSTGDIDIISRLETPERPVLKDYIAEWEAVDNENMGYRIRLFHESKLVKTVYVDHGDPLEFDFEDYMDQSGCYTVRVTALADGDYADSRESKPSYPQIVKDYADENIIAGVITGISLNTGVLEITCEEDDTIINRVTVKDSTDIIIDGEEAELEDLSIGDEVIATLYRRNLIRILVIEN